MTALDELLPLRDYTPEQAAAYLGVEASALRSGVAYGSLKDASVLRSPERPVRFYFRGEAPVLVYIGEDALPRGLKEKVLKATVRGSIETMRSRQGKRGRLSVAAEDGIAWSSADGEIGWIELFPPTTLDRYRDEIYETPPVFRQ